MLNETFSVIFKHHVIIALLFIEKLLSFSVWFVFRAALDIQKSLDAPLQQMKALVKKWSLKFHERHYLVILVSEIKQH